MRLNPKNRAIMRAIVTATGVALIAGWTIIACGCSTPPTPAPVAGPGWHTPAYGGMDHE